MNPGIALMKCVTSIGLLLATALLLFAEPPDGNAQIHAATNDSTIVITTTRRLAGAIDSLQWNGHEFINSADHGRQMQSAASFDNTPEANAETFNPTEAGSRRDGDGTNSTSRLLKLSASGNHLRAQMISTGRKFEQAARRVSSVTVASRAGFGRIKSLRIGFWRVVK